MVYEIEFLKALLLTISIETAMLFLLVKVFFKNPDCSNWLLLLTGTLASFATLPYLWFILPLFIKTRIYYIIIGELSVVLVESVIIKGVLKTVYKESLIISVLCNLASFLTGLLINAI